MHDKHNIVLREHKTLFNRERKNHNLVIQKHNIVIGSCFALISITAIAAIVLANVPANVFAENDSTISTTTITIPSACSLTAVVDTAHNATLLYGIYSGGNDYYPNGIGQTTLTAFCNDASGFAIYAVGFSGDEYGATDMLGNNTSATIPTGTATSGSTSQWAMKLAKVTDSTAYNPANLTITNSFDSYHAVPNTYTKVANFSSATDQTLGSKLTTTYAAYISGTQTADTYTGKVKYTLVHPATNAPNIAHTTGANRIGYFPNAGNLVEDTMGDQIIGSTATSAVLWASNFKRSGYGFAGWSDKYDWELGANDASGNGTGANAGYHIYGPNATITFTAGQYSTEGLSLYAVWVPSAGSLQNWNGCSSLAQGAVTALTDQRDNNTYAVAKLADGKCWMIENLRLDYDATAGATNEALSQGYGKSTTYGNFIGLATPETANFVASSGSATEPTTANSIYYAGTQSGTATIDISQTNYAGYRMPRYRNDNTNTDSTTNPNTTVANMTERNQNVYSYGNYYTWSAALANTIYYTSPTATDADGKTSETVNTSLCPAGWKLPRGGNKTREATNDFWALVVTGINGGTNPANYDSSTAPYYTGDSEGTNASIALRSYPNNFLYSGYAINSSVNNRGSSGSYWSSTASNNNLGSYGMFLYSSSVNPGTEYNNKYNGNSIRCLAGS